MEALEAAPSTRRKVVWCSQKGRLVAQDFTQSGLPFLGWSLEILSRSALDPPNLINGNQRSSMLLSGVKSGRLAGVRIIRPTKPDGGAL